MHECGWVHRDISITNILVDEQGIAKLADLEYAKRMDDTKSHRVRTVRFLVHVTVLAWLNITLCRVLMILKRLNSTPIDIIFIALLAHQWTESIPT